MVNAQIDMAASPNIVNLKKWWHDILLINTFLYGLTQMMIRSIVKEFSYELKHNHAVNNCALAAAWHISAGREMFES